MILNGLETERLQLRSLSTSDQDRLMNFYGDPDVTRYYYFEDAPQTNCIKGIEKQLWRYKTYDVGLAGLALKGSNEIIGMCGLLHQELEGSLALEVGYGLMKEYWGKGYAIEAAKFCRDFAFGNEIADKLISMIHPQNLASQSVALRNGMKLSQVTSYKGHEMQIYQITKAEWAKLA